MNLGQRNHLCQRYLVLPQRLILVKGIWFALVGKEALEVVV